MPGGTSPVQRRNAQKIDLDATDFVRRKELGAWRDYGAVSTIIGWSAFTVKELYYLKASGLMFVMYRIAGTSNSVNTSFTLPSAIKAGVTIEIPIAGADNGVYLTTRICLLTGGSNIVNFYSALGSAAWTASGTKAIGGQFVCTT